MLGKEKNHQCSAMLIVVHTQLEKTKIRKKLNLSSDFHEYCLTTMYKHIVMVEGVRKVGFKEEKFRKTGTGNRGSYLMQYKELEY